MSIWGVLNTAYDSTNEDCLRPEIDPPIHYSEPDGSSLHVYVSMPILANQMAFGFLVGAIDRFRNPEGKHDDNKHYCFSIGKQHETTKAAMLEDDAFVVVMHYRMLHPRRTKL